MATEKRVRFKIGEEDLTSEEDVEESELGENEDSLEEDMEELKDGPIDFTGRETDREESSQEQTKTSSTDNYMPPQRREQANSLLSGNKVIGHHSKHLEKLRKLVHASVYVCPCVCDCRFCRMSC